MGDGNLFGDIVNGGTLYNTWKNKNLKQTAEYELKNMLAQSAWEFGSPISLNRNILFDIPNKSVTPYTIGTAGAPTIAPESSSVVSPTPVAGKQVTNTPYIK